jgi:hypothetical protein
MSWPKIRWCSDFLGHFAHPGRLVASSTQYPRGFESRLRLAGGTGKPTVFAPRAWPQWMVFYHLLEIPSQSNLLFSEFTANSHFSEKRKLQLEESVDPTKHTAGFGPKHNTLLIVPTSSALLPQLDFVTVAGLPHSSTLRPKRSEPGGRQRSSPMWRPSAKGAERSHDHACSAIGGAAMAEAVAAQEANRHPQVRRCGWR